MGEYEGENLAKWPQIHDYNMRDYNCSHMIRAMQQTGFHKWGFVIYRCTYSDDTTWNQYIEYIRHKIIRSLVGIGMDLLLPQYLDITVIEGSSALNNASKATVRDQFRDWVAINQDPNHGGPGQANRFAESIPRYRFCIYVDQKCVDTFERRLEWEKTNSPRSPTPYVVCVIIDVDGRPEGEGKGGYPDLEGCTKEYPGWMYLSARSIAELYNALHHHELGDDCGNIIRPPAIYPAEMRQFMPS